MSQAGIFIKGGSAAMVETLTGDTGGAVGPTGNNINVLGTANQIATTGHPGTSTINWAFTPSIVVANNVTLTAGNLNLADTTSSSQGVINLNSNRFMHDSPGASNNTFLGSNSGNFTLSGANNTGIGTSALLAATTPGNNTAIGALSMSAGAVSGANNTAVGYTSLENMTSGANNTAIGSTCMSLGGITTANNTGVGFQCLRGLSGGGNNTGIGSVSMGNATVSGSNNTAIGFESLSQLSSGGSNSAIGQASLQDLSTGSSNTALGFDALNNLSTGSNNVALGASAGGNYTGAEGSNISIGTNVTGTTGESNTLRIGAGNGTGTGQLAASFIQGIFGVTVASPSTVLINSAGQLGTVSSSVRYKDNIESMKDSGLIHHLRPVNFTFKADPEQRPQWGLIAEEVNEVCPELVIRHHQTGEIESVRYLDLIPMLLKEVQELKKALYKLPSQ